MQSKRRASTGVLLYLAIMITCVTACDDCREAKISSKPVLPAPSYPARGAAIADSMLEYVLPPPPRDAVAYEVPYPLNNGPAVPVKKRWIWIPDGTKIRLSSAAGRFSVKIPVGAKLWKEFYVKAGQKPRLVERRILLKVSDRNEENGWLLNGGWLLYTSHHLPRRADGKNGFEIELTVPLDEADPYFFRPDSWMPTQGKGASTFVTFTGKQARAAYVFPGMTQCILCHDGAAGAYANPEPYPVLAFGPHPDNLTTASFRALVKRGWIDAPQSLIQTVSSADRSSGVDEQTWQLLSRLRNNCLSCHNSSTRATGKHTAFVLEPGQSYPAQTLLSRLKKTSSVMGSLGVSVVTPGSPEHSELILRLRGAEGRRRMPPAEGGLPDPDEGLTALATSWVLGQ